MILMVALASTPTNELYIAPSPYAWLRSRAPVPTTYAPACEPLSEFDDVLKNRTSRARGVTSICTGFVLVSCEAATSYVIVFLEVRTILYNGEGVDSRTGLYNFRARWYSASSGRFERLDPFAGNPNDPFSFNKYGFVHGDPVMGTDPNGENLIGIGLAIGVLMLVAMNARTANAPNIGDPVSSMEEGMLDDLLYGAGAGLAIRFVIRPVVGVSMRWLGSRATSGSSVGRTVAQAGGDITSVAERELVAQTKLTQMTGQAFGVGGRAETAHYLGRHSPQVTLADLTERATNAIDPITKQVMYYGSGKLKYLDSTRFTSYEAMLEAIETATKSFRAETGVGIASKPYSITIDMLRPVGEGFSKKTGVYKAGLQKVYVLLNEFGEAITAYPIYAP